MGRGHSEFEKSQKAIPHSWAERTMGRKGAEEGREEQSHAESVLIWGILCHSQSKEKSLNRLSQIWASKGSESSKQTTAAVQ